MPKYVWAIVSISLLVFIFFLVEVGVGPRPIQIIRPSLAGDVQEVGYWTYRQVRNEIIKYNIVVWGYENSELHEKALLGFWENAIADNQKFTLFVKPAGESITLPIQTVTLADLKKAAGIIKPMLNLHSKILILLPSNESSHTVKESLVHKLEEEVNKNILTVSVLDWRPDHPGYKLVEQHCDDAKRLTGFPDFQFFRCIYERRTRKLLKLKTENKVGFMLDQYGSSDYLLLIYP
jgi:hypothetical protein